jgi:hypothetical protein
VKALSVRQPYAALLVTGAKRAEYRSWSTHYRGPLLIHAAKGEPWDVEDPALVEALASTDPVLVARRGAIIGRVTVTGCRWVGDDWAWDVVDPIIFERPIPWRGAPSIFDVALPR